MTLKSVLALSLPLVYANLVFLCNLTKIACLIHRLHLPFTGYGFKMVASHTTFRVS